MCVLNDLDRFHLACDVLDRVPGLGTKTAYVKQALQEKLVDHRNYVCRTGDDMPEIKNWAWRR
jgi:xylulose-5-phosphate/fructose-6-phosphate phosphoketolase